jgi:hypothetical protein
MGYHTRIALTPKQSKQAKPSTRFTPEPPRVQTQVQRTPPALPKVHPNTSIFETDLDNPHRGLFGSFGASLRHAVSHDSNSGENHTGAPDVQTKRLSYPWEHFDPSNPSAYLFGSAAPSTASHQPIQAKLAVGAVGDKYEQEADAVATQVVTQINAPERMQREQDESQIEPEALQQKGTGEDSALQRLQRREMSEAEERQRPSEGQPVGLEGGPVSTDFEAELQGAKGHGQALDPNLQASMGQAMGADFSGVKVHTDTQSDQLNQSIQAKAFTTGQDVFFRQGEYQPESRSGQELIAHELTHVMQQQGTQQPTKFRRQSTGILAQKRISKPQRNTDRNTDTELIHRMFNMAFEKDAKNPKNAIISSKDFHYVRESNETTGGPHITPNSLFVMQVRSAVVGQEFKEAYKALKKLYSTHELKKEDEVDGSKKNLWTQAQNTWKKYENKDSGAIDDIEKIQSLQELGWAYIRSRNARKGAIIAGVSGKKEVLEEKENETQKKAERALDLIKLGQVSYTSVDSVSKNNNSDDQAVTVKKSKTEQTDMSNQRNTRSKTGVSSGLSSIDVLAQSIVEWCDTGALLTENLKPEDLGGKSDSTKKTQASTMKKLRGEWAQRHYEDALQALGIDSTIKYQTQDLLTDKLKPLFKKKFEEKIIKSNIEWPNSF